MQVSLKRKVRARSKHPSTHHAHTASHTHPPNYQSSQPQPLLPSKLNLRRLSFSFYGEETMRKSKQVILDNCPCIN